MYRHLAGLTSGSPVRSARLSLALRDVADRSVASAGVAADLVAAYLRPLGAELLQRSAAVCGRREIRTG
jgi:hypothetical protein